MKTIHDFAKVAGLAIVMSSVSASAALTGFVSNPTSNSTDWLAVATGLAGSVVTVQDFDDHAVGALNPTNFPGMTLAGTGYYQEVVNSAGPGNPGSGSPSSSGEGTHGISNILGANPPVGGAPGTLTVTFDAAVTGFGLMTIDMFTPTSRPLNTLTIEAFDGPNATGSSLGSVTAAQLNLQQNRLYFMGLISDANDIRSVVFTNIGGDGDQVPLDHLTVVTVPESSSMSLLSLCAVLMLSRRRR
ncbi:MAG: hypothetical protein H7A51_18370 [Akkermansiaceae bacterium]|nr:hypothetical protein [Akkermansiaceae bacterium]